MDRIPHRFVDAALAELALTHASTRSAQDNERLEFLGDAVLDLLVAEELFRAHADLNEGELTEFKSHVVSRRTLAEAARGLGLHDLARLGSGLARRALSRSVLANLYEAVFGAVYLDAGLEAGREFMRATLAKPLGEALARRGTDNPKKRLQEICQARWGEPPEYETIETRGAAHARAFLVCVNAGSRAFPTAWGRTRKEAEQWAAHEALLILEEQPA
ncbi:MAG: ribonuclease III [Planctomycetes bacterium]|jgi:ribonuclease-3|nr:ribonuclease III [Planctomycetota bacterium]HJO27667.1 ribonuclease III [Planctomycetota bacterium]